MSKYDGQPDVTVRRGEDVWFRAYCMKCKTDCEGVERLDRIGKKESALKPRCSCGGDFQLVEVPRGDA